MPTIEVIENAHLTANSLSDRDATVSGAIYESNGRLVGSSVRSIDSTDTHQPDDPKEIHPPPAIVGRYGVDGVGVYLEEAIFLGHVFAGWGHNITETLSTAWASERLPADIPLVLVPWGRLWASEIPRIKTLLGMAGWGGRTCIFISSDAVIGKVHVPERLIRIGEILDEGASIPGEMGVVYNRMISVGLRHASPLPVAPTYLARPVGHRRAHPYEAVLREVLAKSGFRVIEGWKLNCSEQVAAANGASVLVGFSGSSLHNSVFAGFGIPVVEILDERATEKFIKQHPLQRALCELIGQPFGTIPGYSRGEALSVDCIVHALEKYLPENALLEEPVADIAEAPTEPRVTIEE